MFWFPQKQTYLGTTFSPYTALHSEVFDISQLLVRSVASKGEDQVNHEDHNDLNDIDEHYPLLPPDPFNEINGVDPPPDPWNEVDDLPPPPPPPSPRKHHCTPSFEEVVAAGKHIHGNSKNAKSHKHRALKHQRRFAADGQTSRASTMCDYICPAQPTQTAFDAGTLPSTQGAYVAKTEPKMEKYGSKVPRSLTELIAHGFQLIKWNRYDPQLLVKIHGQVFAVLVGQPRSEKYATSVRAAYDTITHKGIVACFPASMRKHRHGLFAAVNVDLFYGKGQTAPSWLHTNYDKLANHLLAIPHVGQMATFASGRLLP
ncbi:hypothetical protein B0H19DRAFT_1064923 [Mycena capillaripes]|nr:hypothetical protein B0H19DRAFT_1064923 [Mycena capillaripes]